MASPTAVFEVRPANGTANAGGGFDSAFAALGSDFSQQNAVQVNFDGVTVTATTAGASSTITLTGYTPLLNDRGNYLAITGGVNFRNGLFRVSSTDGVNLWTLDSTVTTGAGTGMTGNMGGARLGFHAGSPINSLSSALVAGNTVYVKNEAWNEAVVFLNSGAAGNPITIEGYNASRGDAPAGATRPTNNRAAALGDAITVSGTNYVIKYIITTGAGDAGFSLTTQPLRLEFCRATANTGEGLENGGNLVYAIGCEFDANGVGGMGTSIGSIFGCYIHDNAGQGVLAGANGFNMSFSISETNTSHGVSGITSQSIVTNNTFYGSSGVNTDGALWGTPNLGAVFANNICANNARYGVNATDGDSIYADYNDYFGNGTAARNNVPVGTHDLTSDPQFSLGSAANFSIAASLPGYPGAFAGGSSVGYLFMGAVQPQAQASGSGTTVTVVRPLVISPNNVVMT